jgi:hypothetical protein
MSRPRRTVIHPEELVDLEVRATRGPRGVQFFYRGRQVHELRSMRPGRLVLLLTTAMPIPLMGGADLRGCLVEVGEARQSGVNVRSVESDQSWWLMPSVLVEEIS